MASAADARPLESLINARLTAAFAPTVLTLVNESHKHSVPPGSETHFKVLVVSAAFAGKSLLERHRLVNEAIAGGAGLPLPPPLHALSISAKTPEQYTPETGIHTTPACKGGAGK